MRSSRAIALAILCSVPLTGQQPAPASPGVIGEVFAADAKLQGSVILAGSGTQIASGAGVTAGSEAAVLRLARGGELRICPRTSLTVSSSNSGRELLMALGTGAVQLDYKIQASADAIMTPDLRIQLPGPGTFRLQVRADADGNTCIRSLEGNTSAVIVTELLGDGTYQVKPSQQVLFRNGKVSEPWPVVESDCGCPPPQFLQNRAMVSPAVGSAQEQPAVPSVTPKPVEGAALAPVSPAPLRVEAPIVYRASEQADQMPPITASIRLGSAPRYPILTMALPPPAPVPVSVQPAAAENANTAQKSDKRSGGVFAKLGRFFSRMFKGS